MVAPSDSDLLLLYLVGSTTILIIITMSLYIGSVILSTNGYVLFLMSNHIAQSTPTRNILSVLTFRYQEYPRRAPLGRGPRFRICSPLRGGDGGVDTRAFPEDAGTDPRRRTWSPSGSGGSSRCRPTTIPACSGGPRPFRTCGCLRNRKDSCAACGAAAGV